jgi:hypothetical protein
MRPTRKAIAGFVATAASIALVGSTAGCAETATYETHNSVAPLESAAGRVRDGRVTLWAEGGDPLVLVSDSEEHYAMEETGVLAYDETTGCLTFASGPASHPTGIVWPRGTRPVLDDGLRGVDVAGIGRIHEGDEMVVIGGGESWPDGPPSFYRIDDDAEAARCVRDVPGNEVFVAGVIEGVTRR